MTDRSTKNAKLYLSGAEEDMNRPRKRKRATPKVPRQPLQTAPLSPLLQRELQAAKDMVEAGVEPNLIEAIETCIRYSGEGPFTPREVTMLRAQVR